MEKRHKLQNESISSKVEYFFITETWLYYNFSRKVFPKIIRQQLCRSDRTTSVHGETAVFDKCLELKPSFQRNTISAAWFFINDILLIVIYNPPSDSKYRVPDKFR